MHSLISPLKLHSHDTMHLNMNINGQASHISVSSGNPKFKEHHFLFETRTLVFLFAAALNVGAD